MDRPFEDKNPFEKVDMSFKDGLINALFHVKESYRRDETVNGCPIALNMVMALRGDDKSHDAYADITASA